MLIRCNGNNLIPLSRIDVCEDKGDTIVIMVAGKAYYAQGDEAEVIRSLVATKPQSAAKDSKYGKQEEGIAAIPVFPQGGKRNVAAR